MSLANKIGSGVVTVSLIAAELCPAHPKKPHVPEEKDGGLTARDLTYEARQTVITTTTMQPPPPKAVIVRQDEASILAQLTQRQPLVIYRHSGNSSQPIVSVQVSTGNH